MNKQNARRIVVEPNIRFIVGGGVEKRKWIVVVIDSLNLVTFMISFGFRDNT